MKTNKTVDRESKEKLYVQIYSILLEKIEIGDWPDGTQIPTEDELCKIYDVSKVTVREAMQELVREGFLKRQQGKGTFVTKSFQHLGIVMKTRLSENDLYGEEVKIHKIILERGVRGVPEEIRNLLMTDEDIYCILSRKLVDDEPFNDEFFIPVFILPDIYREEISDKSLYALIEEKGTKKVFRILQTVESVKIKENEAAVLRKEEGFPALLITRIFLSSDGSPVACSRITGSGEKLKLRMEFERVK